MGRTKLEDLTAERDGALDELAEARRQVADLLAALVRPSLDTPPPELVSNEALRKTPPEKPGLKALDSRS